MLAGYNDGWRGIDAGGFVDRAVVSGYCRPKSRRFLPVKSITRLSAFCTLDQLTGKEREIACHLAQHKSSKQIGYDLGITENTVNKHLAAIRAKWMTRDRFETASSISPSLQRG